MDLEAGISAANESAQDEGCRCDGGQPRNFLRPCALLLLKEAPAHGYDLVERLVPLGIGPDPGGLYRMVRTLETEGLVRSGWEIAASGRDRRKYELTEAGEASLRAWVATLNHSRRLLETFAGRYDAAALLALEFAK